LISRWSEKLTFYDDDIVCSETTIITKCDKLTLAELGVGEASLAI